MNKIAAGLIIAFIFGAASSGVRSAPITYAMNFEDEVWGSIAFGTITIKDGVFGPVLSGDISAWSFTWNSDYFTIQSSDNNSSSRCLGVAGCFTATPEALFFNFGSSDAYFRAQGVYDEQPEKENRLGFWFDGWGNRVKWEASYCEGCWGFAAFPDGLVAVGAAIKTPLPEPSTGTLFCIAAFAARLISRRKNQSVTLL